MRYFLPHPSAEASEFSDNYKFTSALQQFSYTREKITTGASAWHYSKNNENLLAMYEKKDEIKFLLKII